MKNKAMWLTKADNTLKSKFKDIKVIEMPEKKFKSLFLKMIYDLEENSRSR
jgi:hypothetical protein